MTAIEPMTNTALPIPNETYAGIKLVYTPSLAEPAFQEVGGLRRVGRRALSASITAAIAVVLSWVPIGILAVLGLQIFPPNLVAAGAGLLPLGVWMAVWLYSFMREDDVAVGSWQYLAEGLASSAETVYTQTLFELVELRAVPPGLIRLDHRCADAFGRWFLRVSYDSYHVHVAVVPFGRDLHVGWTMVQSRTGFDHLAEFFAFFRAGWFEREVAASRPKAMRDSVHHSLNNSLGFAAAGHERPYGPAHQPATPGEVIDLSRTNGGPEAFAGPLG